MKTLGKSVLSQEEIENILKKKKSRLATSQPNEEAKKQEKGTPLKTQTEHQADKTHRKSIPEKTLKSDMEQNINTSHEPALAKVEKGVTSETVSRLSGKILTKNDAKMSEPIPPEGNEKREVTEEDIYLAYERVTAGSKSDKSKEGDGGFHKKVDKRSKNESEQDNEKIREEQDRKLSFKEEIAYKGKNKRKKDIIGIDIKYSSITLAILNKNNKSLCLDREEVKGGIVNETLNIENIHEILSGFVEKYKLKKKEVVVCLSEKFLFTKIFKIVKMSRRELNKAVLFEIQKRHIPFNIDEGTIRYLILRETKDSQGDKYEILITGAPNNILEKISNVIIESGLKLVSIDTESMAIVRYMNYVYKIESDQIGVVFNVGILKTQVIVVKGGMFVWGKEIAIGARDFTETIADYLMVDLAKAEELKKNKNNFEVLEATRPIFQQLILESNRILEYCLFLYPSYKINQIILTGEAGGIAGIEDIYVKNFGGVVKLLNTKIEIVKNSENNKNVTPDFAVSIGLSLWNKKDKNINLAPRMKGQSSYSSPAIKLGPVVLVVLGLLLMTISIIGIPKYISIKKKPLHVSISQYSNEIAELNQQKGKIDKFLKLELEIKRKKKIVDEIKKESVRILSPLNELSRIIPKGVLIIFIKYTSGNFTLKGLAETNQRLNIFFNNLRNSYSFDRVGNVVVHKSSETQTYGYEFDVKFHLIGSSNSVRKNNGG